MSGIQLRIAWRDLQCLRGRGVPSRGHQRLLLRRPRQRRRPRRGSVPPQMVADVPVLRGLISGSKPICPRQTDRYRNTRCTHRRSSPLPDFPCPDNELAPDEGYLLYFGRLSAEKGVDDLLLALTEQPLIPVVIAGDGPEREHLESLAMKLNLKRVIFTGMLLGEKLRKLIAGCSFTIFPSHAYETLGKSILKSATGVRAPCYRVGPRVATRVRRTWCNRPALPSGRSQATF